MAPLKTYDPARLNNTDVMKTQQIEIPIVQLLINCHDKRKCRKLPMKYSSNRISLKLRAEI